MASMLEQLASMPMPAAAPAPDMSTMNALQRMPIFGDAPLEDRNRALALAGLNMMKYNPQGGMGQFTQGVEAGLGSLEADEAQRTAAEQQQVQNAIQAQGALSDQERAAAATTTAATGEAQQEEAVRQFDAEASTRKADEVLKLAQAGYYDRMPLAKDASGKVSEASIMENFISAQMNALAKANPEAWTDPNTGQRDDNRLRVQATQDYFHVKQAIGNENLAFVLQNPEQADTVRTNMSSFQTKLPDAPAVQMDVTRLQQTPVPVLAQILTDQNHPFHAATMQLLTTDPEARAYYDSLRTQK